MAGRQPRVPGETRTSVTISFVPSEKEELDRVKAQYHIGQSDMLRFIMRNPWLLALTEPQLADLRQRAARMTGG